MVHHRLHSVVSFLNALGHLLEIVLNVKAHKNWLESLCHEWGQVALERLVVQDRALNLFALYGLELSADCPVSVS